MPAPTITTNSPKPNKKSNKVINTDKIKRNEYLKTQNPFHASLFILIEDPELFGEIEIKATKAKVDVVSKPSIVIIELNEPEFDMASNHLWTTSQKKTAVYEPTIKTRTKNNNKKLILTDLKDFLSIAKVKLNNSF